MENTNCGVNCPFVKNGVCKSDNECCNYNESWWIPNNSEKPVLVKDCTPKRLLLMQQDQVNYTLHLQKSIEEMKKEIAQLTSMLTAIINQTQAHLHQIEIEQKNLINHKQV